MKESPYHIKHYIVPAIAAAAVPLSVLFFALTAPDEIDDASRIADCNKAPVAEEPSPKR